MVTADPRAASQDMLKIAVVVNTFPSVSETFILNQITGLLDRGHSVDIVASRVRRNVVLHPDVRRYNLLSRTHTIHTPAGLFKRSVRAAGLIIACLPRDPRLLRTLDVFHYGRPALTLRPLYTSIPFLTRYDVVHCQYGPNGEAVGALVKRLGFQQRLVTTFHRYDLRLAEEQGSTIFEELRRQGDCFLSISSHTREALLRLGFDPAKIVYHPVGIDTRLFLPSDRAASRSSRQVRIATVARLVPQKDLHTGIRAIARLVRTVPGLQVRYDIVGGGPLRDELTQLAEALGLGGVVHFHGPLPQDRVVEILGLSDIFLLPSRDEVLPVSLMEAQAMGLPAIASAVAATAEIVLDGRSGFLVPPGDPDAIAAKLQLLIEHPERRGEFGLRGRRHIVAHFDIDILNDRLVEIYRRVVAGRPLAA